MTLDKAGKEYWDRLWANRPVPRAVEPDNPSLDNYSNRQFHAFFTGLFWGLGKETRLLEIGCAGSEWLPYFKKQFGFEIEGLDYSEIGCEQARAVLEAEQVDGKIILADFFNPPVEMLGQYDVVVSFGVMEHFQDTVSAVRAAASLVKPGGMLVTVIPNVAGLNGHIQKFLSRSILEKHVPLTRQSLEAAHIGAGLDVFFSNYFLSTNFGVLNVSDVQKNKMLKTQIHLFLTRISKLVWTFEKHVLRLPVLPYFAPYIICVGRKNSRGVE